jgi:serine/threonine protein kinase
MNLEYRNNINDDFNLKNLSVCMDLINKNKVEILGKGLQGEVFKAKSPECGSVVIKKKLIKEKDKKWKDNEEWLKEELFVEYKIMQMTNRMIKKFICPNFIQAYDFDRKLGLLVMEYADGDTKFLFKNEFYEDNIYKSYICQVLIGLYAFNNYTMLDHRDIKPENILYKKIDKNTVFHYKIGDIEYYVPTFGYLFMIADFGIANYKLGNRLPDIDNFNYKIIVNYLTNFSLQYPKLINKNEIDNFIKIIGNSKDKYRSGDIIKRMVQLGKLIKDVKGKKMNNYVLNLYDILSSEKDGLKIIDLNFKDFTKNTYQDSNIVDFTIDF